MKLLLFVFVFFFFALSAFGQNDTSVAKFDPTRNPFDDLKIAIDSAKNVNKRIVLDVGGEWCIWCHRIDSFMETNSEIQSILKKYYIFVKVNYSKENKNEKFLSKYPEVQGYPHFFVLDKDGNLIHSQNTGELEKDDGYNAEKFLAFLNKWLPNN